MLIKGVFLYLAGLLDISIGLFVHLKNRKAQKNTAFLFLTLSIGIWSISIANVLLAESRTQSLFWLHVVILCMIFIPTTLYHLAIAFSFKGLVFPIKSILLVYTLNLWVVLGCFIPGFYIKDVLFYNWGKLAVFGLGHHLLAFVYLIIVVLAFRKLYTSIHSAEFSLRERQLNRYLFYSLIMAFVFGSIFNWVLVLLGHHELIWVGPYALFIFVGAISYAIIKRRFLDITIVIRKSLVYSTLVGLFTALYIFIIFLLSHVFQVVTGYNSILVAAIVILVFALGFQPLRNRIQDFVDRKFFKRRYDYQKTLKEVSQSTVNMIELDRLLPFVLRSTVETLKIDRAGVYLFEAEQQRFVLKEQV
ncbi:histidine kinase N-terminal 7TM domain-containing protein [Candidatus Margulisiibacteriota bacterium]